MSLALVSHHRLTEAGLCIFSLFCVCPCAYIEAGIDSMGLKLLYGYNINYYYIPQPLVTEAFKYKELVWIWGGGNQQDVNRGLCVELDRTPWTVELDVDSVQVQLREVTCKRKAEKWPVKVEDFTFNYYNCWLLPLVRNFTGVSFLYSDFSDFDFTFLIERRYGKRSFPRLERCVRIYAEWRHFRSASTTS